MPVNAGDVRVVFMGSPEFAAPSLQALHTAGYRIELVVTQPDRPAGRGGRILEPPVKSVAASIGTAILQPETLKDEEARAAIVAARADVIVVAAYGKILPRAVLEAAGRGCINVHASLLPRWRGASPVSAAILAGDSQTGVTIMEMAPKMDAGPILAQRTMAIGMADTTGTLEPRLADRGAALLTETLPAWLAGQVAAVEQDHDAATYCWTLSKADGQLSRSMTVHDAERAVRAYDPWPGAFVEYRGQRLAIWRTRCESAETPEPGTLTVIAKAPAIAFGGGWLLLEEVQKPGGKRLPAAAFLNGERGELPPVCGLRD